MSKQNHIHAILIIGWGLFACCNSKINTSLQTSKNSVNDLTNENIAGNVKIVISTHFEVTSKQNAIDTEVIKNQVTVDYYNRKGNKYEESTFNGDSVLLSKTAYTYDKKGNIIKTAHYEGAESTLNSTEVDSYDRKGNKFRNKQYSYNGKLLSISDYKITQNPNESVCVRRGADGNFISKEIYKYDRAGNPVAYFGYNYKEELDNKIMSEYDKKGRLLVLNWIYPEFKDSVVSRMKYDEKDNLTEKHVNEFGKIQDFIYDYEGHDPIGNWTKRTTYKDCKPLDVTKRQILYY